MKQPWYADNEHRDYPFLTQTSPTTALPRDAIVDFGAILGVAAGFRNATDIVYLHRIERAADVLTYAFRTTAPGASGEECLFHRDIATAEEFQTEWTNSVNYSSDASSSSLLSSASSLSGCPQRPAWQAFMVTGTLDGIVELLPTDGIIIFPSPLWTIEPARLQNLSRTGLTSISLANYPRRTITPPPGCGDAVAATEPIVAAECLTGHLRIAAGYNAAIRQESQNNAIIIGAGVGAGDGEPTAEVPLYPGETALDGSPRLSGGPTCGQVLKRVNGVAGRHIPITAGYGITVSASTDEANTLIISRDSNALIGCDPSSLSLSSSL